MLQKLNPKFLLKITFIVFVFFIYSENRAYSQTIREDTQDLYDRTQLIGIMSLDQGNSLMHILTYFDTYGFAKIFTEEEISRAFATGETLTHSHNLHDHDNGGTNPYYYENIYLRAGRSGAGPIINLHRLRGNNSYQPQWPYCQTFAVYKILIPFKAKLIIDNANSILESTVMYLGLKHDPSYNGSLEDCIHIFEYDTNGFPLAIPDAPDRPDPGDYDPSAPASMEADLPAGEYYLLVSGSASGMRMSYPRGWVTTNIRIEDSNGGVEDNNGNRVSYQYDLSGNITSRKVIILKSSVSVAEAVTAPKVFEDERLNIKIYPNPTRGYLKVEIPDYRDNETLVFQIYDLNGQLLLNTKKNEAYIDLDMSRFTNGTYILRMTRKGANSSWRIIKTN